MVQHEAKMAPNIDPGGLSEAAGAARSTQEQQSATKNIPRATQERPKSAGKRFSRFSRPRGVPDFGAPGVAVQTGGPGFGGGRLLERRFRVECVADVLFFRGPRKNGPPKLKLKL